MDPSSSKPNSPSGATPPADKKAGLGSNGDAAPPAKVASASGAAGPGASSPGASGEPTTPAFLQPSDDPREIAKLGSYGILRILGKGGMGMVLLAHDKMLDRQVAIKLMLPEVATPQNRDRFFREARATAALQHDHIVPIFQIGDENGFPYLVMPYLQGEALDRRLARERKPPVKETMRIVRETAMGLMAAHAKGMIHRDIKPANLWLEAPRGRVRILDFGLARTRAAASDVRITQVGAIMGSPAYMSPEQAAGRELDFRADLFSLGVTFYEMLSGARPFRGQDTMAILAALLTTSPPAPSELDSTIPKEVSQLAMAMIAKDPQNRPASARDVAVMLAKLEKAPSFVPPSGTAPPSAGSVPAPPGGRTDVPGAPPAVRSETSCTSAGGKETGKETAKEIGKETGDGSGSHSAPTPAFHDRVFFDTKMIEEAIPEELRGALLPGLSSAGDKSGPQVLSLELLAGGAAINRVRGEKILVGRADGTKLRIQSSQVSRNHAQIVWSPAPEGGHYEIDDLRSTNGTFINDSQVRKATPLLPGDQLHFGALGFRVDYSIPAQTLKKLLKHRHQAGYLGAKRVVKKEAPPETPTIGIALHDGGADPAAPAKPAEQATRERGKMPKNENG